MKSIAENISDYFLRSQIDLERFSTSVRRQVVGILKKTQDEILAQIFAHEPTKPLTPWKRERLLRLSRTVSKILDKDYDKISALVNKELVGLGRFVRDDTLLSLNGIVGVDIFRVHLTQESLKSLVQNTMIDGAVIGQWWTDQSDDFKKKFSRSMADVSQQVTVESLKGESVMHMARQIRGTGLIPGIMKTATRQAASLVRTSTMQVASQTRMRIFENNSDLIQGYEFWAVLDSRTTRGCASLDRKRWRFDREGNLHGVGHRFPLQIPPLHWQCRSLLNPILKDFSDLVDEQKSPLRKRQIQKLRKLERQDPGIRASWSYSIGDQSKRDRMGRRQGAGKPIPAKTDYERWLESQPEEVQQDVLGPARFNLWKAGKLKAFSDLVRQTNPQRSLNLSQLYERLHRRSGLSKKAFERITGREV